MKHDYEKIVHEALTEPGKLSTAYSAFWNYSLGNQILAMWQLGHAEPINTFVKWKDLGRHVKKGSKALELLMPITVKAKEGDEDDKKTIFLPKRHWFALSQTDGAEYVPPPIPDFDIAKAERELEISIEPFHHSDGNCQGYAITDKRIIAINPVAYDAFKTTAHEIGHVLLHPSTISADTQKLTRDIKEVEAELTAYLVCSSLGKTDNLHFSRGYIQNWITDGTVEKVRFSSVFSAADRILRAGRIEPDRPRGPPDQPEAPTPAA
jgi:antirestriction protein ArdC